MGRKLTAVGLEKKLLQHIDESFEGLKTDLKEYVDGYFVQIQKTTDKIREVQFDDGEEQFKLFNKWDRDYFPEILQNSRRIKSKQKASDEDIKATAKKAVEEAIKNVVPKAIEDGIDAFIESKKGKVQNRKLFGIIPLRPKVKIKDGK